MGIAVLASLYRKLEGLGVEFCVLNPGRDVSNVLAFTKMDGVLRVRHTKPATDEGEESHEY